MNNCIYGMINSEEVDRNLREQAERMLAYCRAELNLPMVTIKWFVPKSDKSMRTYKETFNADTEKLAGLFDPKEPHVIKVKAHMLTWNTMETVAHECFHLFQTRGRSKEYVPLNKLNEWMEKGADEFQKYAIDNYIPDDKTYLDHLTGKDYSKPIPPSFAVAKFFEASKQQETNRGTKVEQKPNNTSNNNLEEHKRRFSEAVRKETRSKGL